MSGLFEQPHIDIKGVTFNQDGGVTLDGQTWDDLKDAYNALHRKITNGPMYIGDYFADDEDLYRKICHWKTRVDGEVFNPEDYGLDEELDEDFDLPPDSLVRKYEDADYLTLVQDE